MRATFILLSFMLLSINLAHAQETTPEPSDGWTIEQRCVGEPTIPPDDWSFDGVLILENETVIRGWRADLDTTYRIAYRADEFAKRGALSPDNRLYATPDGYVSYWSMTANAHYVNTLRVFSTDPSQQTVVIASDQWWLYELKSVNHFGGTGVPRPYWLDNERFTYYADSPSQGKHYFVVNALTGDLTPWVWEGAVDPIANRASSPDLTRTFVWHNRDTASRELSLYDTQNGEILVQQLPLDSHEIYWQPDSSAFIDQTDTQLIYYDRTGQDSEVVFEGRVAFRVNMQLPGISWSSDLQYAAFMSNDTLHMIDMGQEKIIDTCLSNDGGFAWNGNRLVFSTNDSIYLFNTEAWTTSQVGTFDGSVIGWRAAD